MAQAAVAAPAAAPVQALGRAAQAREPANQNLELDALVRVPRRKLDSLLTQSGELLTARRRFDARRTELAALQDFVASVSAQWRSADPYLKRWLNADAKPETHAQNDVWTGKSVPRKAARALHATREHLTRLERDIDGLCAGLVDDIRTLERTAGALADQIHQVRMLPFLQACEGLFRCVRDVALAQGKEVELSIDGGDVELDRALIDALRDPLLHIVRNAVDHGVESPEQRRAAGKSARAAINIAVRLRSQQVEVTIRDDGRGIDFEAVRAVACERDATLSPERVDPARMIFEPGFSTGRGVGLDVVKTQIEAMRGSVEVSSTLGQGTLFALNMPLTVTTLRVLFVKVGGETYALPSSSVWRLVRASSEQIGLVEGREMLLLGDMPIPIVSLAELLGSPASAPTETLDRLPLVLTGRQHHSVAFAVDELVSEQDVVCKPLGRRIGRMQHVSSASVLPNGELALLLKPAELMRMGVSRAPARRAAFAHEPSAKLVIKRLLLVDDSATTRTLEKSILEAAGYEILLAVDGSNAWQLLQEKGADLIVSDVEMPNMDGFALTQAVRGSKRFRDVPVVLLTSLDSAEDRARGMQSGANAYLVKSAFDQTNLLETIRQLL
jgi:two-component system chemotaxis sensor kinase CheA